MYPDMYVYTFILFTHVLCCYAGVVVGNKVGVVIGGHGQSVGGVGDFHVKSLDEIKAEKRKRLAAAEVETTGRNEGVCVFVSLCVLDME